MNWKGIQVWGDSVLKGVVFDSGRNRYCVLKENAVSQDKSLRSRMKED